MEETISLKEIFEVIKKRILLIIAFVLGAALVAAAVSYFYLTPKYESSSQFIVNQGEQQSQQDAYNLNDIRLNVELINTYRVIIKSERILDQVIDTLNLDYSASTLESKLSVESAQDSQVVTVKATDANPNIATDIANSTVAIFQKEIPILYNVDNVQVLSEAKTSLNPSPVAPNPKLNIAIAIVLGGMIGVGVAFLLEYLDNAIKTEHDVKKHLELPVLGLISHVTDQDVRENIPMNHTSLGERGGYSGQTQKK